MVTSGLGVAINVATDLEANPVAWVAVVVLTVAGVVIGMRGHHHHNRPHESPPSVHNSVSGTVHGQVVQAGTLSGGLTIDSSTRVDQSAVARDGGTVYQAGRDVNPNP